VEKSLARMQKIAFIAVMFNRESYLTFSVGLALMCSPLAHGQDEAPQTGPEGQSSNANAASQSLNQPPGLAPSPQQPTPIVANNAAPPSFRDVLPDAANGTKFYTLTASLREAYDDNIYTTKSNRVGSAVTEFSPSVLVNFPMENSTFSGRYTFGLDYYEARRGDTNDYTNELSLHYTHQFTDRFSLDLRDQFGYYTQPDLLNAIGSPFVSGSYFANTAGGDFDAQWTRLFGTTTSYSNIAILYDQASIGTVQNSDENTLSQDFRFAIAPKYNFVTGFIFDRVDYFGDIRGYTNYTIDAGLDWQVLPTLSLDIRGGGSYTVSDSTPDSVSPYAALTLGWALGKRSSLEFSYVHDVVPSDVSTSVGQEADRFSIRFNYLLATDISLHLAGIETHSNYTSTLLENGTPSFSEDDIGVDLGGEYRVSPHFSLEAGYFLSDISSQESFRDYTRNQIYLGVRGTY
jgi:hypothetical protein